MLWECMMVAQARNERVMREMNDAATKIQALWRGHQAREWLDDDWNETLFAVEYGTYQELGHAAFEQSYGWLWANMCFQYVKDGVLSYEEQWDKENQFGPEYSSDNSGDGPFGAILLVIVLVLDKLNSQRGRIGQWRAKDRALKQLSEEYPFTFVVTCTLIRHKIGRDYYLKAANQLGKRYRSNNAGDGPDFDLPEMIWSADEQVLWWMACADILTLEQVCALVPKTRNAVKQALTRLCQSGKIHRIGQGEYMFGPAYSSDNAGDGPARLERIELDTLNASLFMHRYEVLVECFDLQVWTFCMRLPEYEYMGVTFDHHEEFGSTEMIKDLSALRDLLNIWLRGDEHSFFSVQTWLWDKCISHFETLEMTEFFHDDHVNSNLRDLIRDMILLKSVPGHHLLPRPHSEKIDFVPLF